MHDDKQDEEDEIVLADGNGTLMGKYQAPDRPWREAGSEIRGPYVWARLQGKPFALLAKPWPRTRASRLYADKGDFSSSSSKLAV
jgi:hypothetical protein